MITKIFSLSSLQTYEIDVIGSGEFRAACPDCSHDRKKSSAKCFSWNVKEQVGFCNHCESKFVLMRKNLPTPPKQYKLSSEHRKYLNGRKITDRTLDKMKIYSDGDWICFPYFKNGLLVNIKKRDLNKNFQLQQGAEICFYNHKALESDEIIIVEGEIDALSFIDQGYENVVSVPTGAGGIKYLEKEMDYFFKMSGGLAEKKKIPKLIRLATDNDEKGIKLRDELSRRLGKENCKFSNFNGWKDANEMLVKEDNLLIGWFDYPVKGAITVKDLWDESIETIKNGMKPGKKLGLSELDEAITWESSRLAIVTGIPGHGKSEFVDFLTVKLNTIWDWKVVYFVEIPLS